jgi:hypothetical protein
MSDTITVVCEVDAHDEAHSMGYRRFADMTAADIVEAWPLEYASHGSWDTHILPTLRCLAGYGDAGYGTYQQRQEVALIRDGDESDHPADALLVDSMQLIDEITDAWYSGAHQAVCDTIRQSDEYSMEDIER